MSVNVSTDSFDIRYFIGFLLAVYSDSKATLSERRINNNTNVPVGHFSFYFRNRLWTTFFYDPEIPNEFSKKGLCLTSCSGSGKLKVYGH